MAKILYIVIAVIVAATLALAAEKEATCTPWLQYCRTGDDCCRHLICGTYKSICIPTGGLVIPGKDKRPIGPGPFPPGYIP